MSLLLPISLLNQCLHWFCPLMFWRWLWIDPYNFFIKTSWWVTIMFCFCSSFAFSACRWWDYTCFWVHFECVLRNGELSLTISWVHRCLWWILAVWGPNRVAMVLFWCVDLDGKSSVLCTVLHFDILYLRPDWACTTLERFSSNLWFTLDTSCYSQFFLSLLPTVILIHP